MNKLTTGFYALMLFLAGISPGYGQPALGGRSRDAFGADIFQIRMVRSAQPGQQTPGCVDAYIQLANDVLTFVKSDSSTWQARFDLELLIYNSKREMAAYRIVRDTVTTDRFEITNSRIHRITKTMRFYLQPGDYTWRLKLLNAEGLPILERQEQLEVPPYGPDQLQMSDILLSDSLDCTGGSSRINLRGSFSRRDAAIVAQFEIYPPAGADSVQAVLTLIDASARKVMEKKKSYAAEPVLRFCLDLGGSVGRPGEYLFRVRANAGSRAIQTEQKILVLWGHAGVRQETVDLAIEQLALIAKGGTIREIERASGAEREKLYSAFWEKRDPTPGTPENELKEEFFFRIDFANRQFPDGLAGREGWRTDRGRVFVQNGTPDNIEKQGGEMGMASVEIWHYNSLNRRYIFVDRLSNGEFRLAKIE